jgi:hypothetical protein
MRVCHDTVGRSVHLRDSDSWTLCKHVTVCLIFVGIGDLPCWGSAEWLWNSTIGSEGFGLTLSRSGLQHVLDGVEGVFQGCTLRQGLFALAREELGGRRRSGDAGALDRLRACLGG